MTWEAKSGPQLRDIHRIALFSKVKSLISALVQDI